MKINYWHSLKYDCYYHIYNRTVDGLTLFNKDSDYKLFLKKYEKYFQPYFITYAYCLIPNHFHFIIKIKTESEVLLAAEKETTVSAHKLINGDSSEGEFLSIIFKRYFSSIAKTYNHRNDHKGAVFQEKVKRVSIDNDDRLRYLIAYVHHNPIHHHLRENYIEWSYSSFAALQSEQTKIIDRKAVIELYEGPTLFSEFHKAFQIMKLEEEID